MLPPLASAQPCYSIRGLRLVAQVLREGPYDVAALEPGLSWLEARAADERVPVSTIHTALAQAVSITGDPLLGVKAAGRISHGDHGVVDFLASSAATVCQGIDYFGRYIRLVSDISTANLTVADGRAIVTIDNSVVLPAAAEDFQLCSVVANLLTGWPSEALSDMDLWFTHSAPDDLTEYRRVVGDVRLHFGGHVSAFGFAAHHLDAPLAGRNPKLHELLCSYAKAELSALPQAHTLTAKVRSIVEAQITHPEFCLEDAARHLHISPRTLGRRLQDEGTLFKDIVDDVRKRVALDGLTRLNLSISEVSWLVGFSDTPAFFRAFRRWTGKTPMEYRWSRRIAPSQGDEK